MLLGTTSAVLDGHPVAVCDIGNVFTASAHRGHGHADVLIERLLDAAARGGSGARAALLEFERSVVT